MNQNQKKYALNRIDALRTIKLRQAEEKFTTKAIEISKEEKYKLIASGKVKILPYIKICQSYCPDLYPSFDFSDYEKPKSLDKSFDLVAKNIESISQKAKDQIMLGDCQEALKLIEQLESIKV